MTNLVNVDEMYTSMTVWRMISEHRASSWDRTSLNEVVPLGWTCPHDR